MNAFDAYIAGEVAAAVDLAKHPIDARIAALRALEIDSDDHVFQALAELRERDECLLTIVNDAAAALRDLDDHRQRLIAHLEGGPTIDILPAIASIVALSSAADHLLVRADALEQNGGLDPATVTLELELRDREALAGAIEMMVARRDGLADRHRYLACVNALSTGAISRLATSLRRDLVTPELSKRIGEEILALGLEHVPLRFTEQSESGKSFFEVALANAGRARKSTVLSEGEQRALAIACFLADATSAKVRVRSSSMIR